MIIGLYGLDFESNNLGCQALSYGFLEILKKIIDNGKEIEIICFDPLSLEKLKHFSNYRNIKVKQYESVSIKTFNGLKRLIDIYKQCNVIFDFTAGDSFSDIYGKKRFFIRTLRKKLVLFSGTPLVLGSQTYGPFNNLFVRLLAVDIMKECYEIFTRDSLSEAYIRELTDRHPIKTVDVAFALPYSNTSFKNTKFKIGFNPSGLLWNGGYTQNNQFGLQFDYKAFCIKLIHNLIQNTNVSIYLISHVRNNDLSSLDNDIIPCAELKRMYPQLIESPYFDNPIEAKSYISGLDLFIGSRMHATIASLGTGVVTIPVAYSRKFKGLFNDLEYPYLVDAQKQSLNDALDAIQSIINNFSDAVFITKQSQKKIGKGVDLLFEKTNKILGELDNE